MSGQVTTRRPQLTHLMVYGFRVEGSRGLGLRGSRGLGLGGLGV